MEVDNYACVYVRESLKSTKKKKKAPEWILWGPFCMQLCFNLYREATCGTNTYIPFFVSLLLISHYDILLILP